MISGKNYIGNQLKAAGSKKFKTINPKLNIQNEWESVEVTEAEIKEATQLAWDAFKSFRKTSDQERAAFLNACADNIEALGEELISTYCLESGLPEGRAMGERGRTCFQLRTFAEMLSKGNWNTTTIEEAIPDRTPLPKSDIRKTYIPLGPVVVFGSSNFPLAYSTAGGDTAAAFAAGCPVLVKSHPMHAGTGELVASAIVKAAQSTGMPNGVFSNLNSSGIEVGKQLVLDPKVKAVGFTGSIKGGRALMDLAATRPEPIPVFAEMGSINPVVITQGALEKGASKWANTYAGSITLGTGQFCTNPGLLLAVASDELDQFASELASKIVEIGPMVMLGPNIKSSFSKLKTDVVSQAGVQVLTAPVKVEGNYADQTVVTVSGAEFLKNPKLHQEVFGPFSVLVKCANEEEMLAIIEGLEGQLTGTIIAEKEEFKAIENIVDAMTYRVGRIIFNGVPTGVEVCPAMNHGGPYPSSSDSRFTAVGLHSIQRWIRPISYQDFPKELLPSELK